VYQDPGWRGLALRSRLAQPFLLASAGCNGQEDTVTAQLIPLERCGVVAQYTTVYVGVMSGRKTSKGQHTGR
jgi:hypothetical protein